MDFSIFFNILFPYIGKNLSEGNFARLLFDKIVDAELLEDDPMIIQNDSTFKHYATNTRGIQRLSKVIYEHLNLGKFAAFINQFDDTANNSICEAFKPYYPKINQINVGGMCAEIFQKIIKDSAESPSRKNTAEKNKQVSSRDIGLLFETNCKCPKCGVSLIKNLKDKQFRNYAIINLSTRLFQKESICLRDEIAICNSCATEFEICLDDDDRILLKRLKLQVSKNKAYEQDIDSQILIDGVDKILSELSKGHEYDGEVKLTKKALRVAKKISNNPILVGKIESDVKRHYGALTIIIENAENEGVMSARKLMNCMGRCFDSFDEQNLTQQEIYDKMADWLNSKTGVNNRTICEVFVSFFVQSCQVFHEITK